MKLDRISQALDRANFDEIVTLVDEVEKTRKLVTELADRKAVHVYYLWIRGWTDSAIVKELASRGYTVNRQRISQMIQRGKRLVE